MKILILLPLILLTACATNKKEEKTASQKKADIYYGQGTRELVHKNYTAALKNLLQANALKPNDTKILNNLGMAYHFKKRPGIATQYLKQSIKIDPKNTDARLNLATLYMQSNSLDEAEVQYKKILDDLTYEGQHRTYYNLGILFQRKNKVNQAVSYFKQSINTNDNYCPAHFKLGEIHFTHGQYKAALKKFKDAGSGICYSSPEPFYYKALTLIKLEKYTTAQLTLEDVMERFAKTKFEPLARRKLLSIKYLKTNNSQPQIQKEARSSKRANRKILSPNF